MAGADTSLTDSQI